MVELKRICGKCWNPTSSNNDTYRDGKTGAETLDCPKCGYDGKEDVFEYTFQDGFNLLHESGVSAQILALGNSYLQLLKAPLEQARNIQQLEEIPEQVRRQLLETAERAQQIILNSGTGKELERMGLTIKIHTTASISV